MGTNWGFVMDGKKQKINTPQINDTRFIKYYHVWKVENRKDYELDEIYDYVYGCEWCKEETIGLPKYCPNCGRKIISVVEQER